MKCWVCGEGPSLRIQSIATPMMLPGFVRPVMVCGNCIIKALRTIEKEKAAKCGG